MKKNLKPVKNKPMMYNGKQLLYKIPFLLLFTFFTCSNTYRSTSAQRERTCISLKGAVSEVISHLNENKKIPDKLNELGGLSWIEGYIVDGDNDIIVFGIADAVKQPYTIADIIHAYKAVFYKSETPFCSLDPIPENLQAFSKILNSKQFAKADSDTRAKLLTEAIGDQLVRVGGVPARSNFAATMLNADYHMKQVTQGHIQFPGLVSVLDLKFNRLKKDPARDIEKVNTLSRFWFHLKKGTPQNSFPKFKEGDGIIMIDKCPMVLLTEKQAIDKSGELVDDIHNENPDSELFAKTFTNQLDNLIKKVEYYAKLESLFRLYAVFRAMRFRQHIVRDVHHGFGSVAYSEANDAPKSMPGIVNLKGMKTKITKGDKLFEKTAIFVVAGGVNMEVKIEELNLSRKSRLELIKNRITEYKPNPKSIIWNVMLSI